MGIEVALWDELTRDERTAMRKLFRERICPVLTPLAVDPAHPFPYISGLSLNLAVTVRNPGTGTTLFARVKVPPQLPRFVSTSKRPVRPAGRRDLRPSRAALQGHGGAGAPRLPGHPQRGPRRRRGRYGEPHAGAGEGAPATPVRATGPAGGRGHHQPGRPRPARRRARRVRPRDLPAAGPARPDRPARDRRPRPGATCTSRPSCRRRPCTPRTTSSPSFGNATSSSTTRTTPSPPACSGSSSRPRPTPACWRSSRRSTGPAATRRSWTP